MEQPHVIGSLAVGKEGYWYFEWLGPADLVIDRSTTVPTGKLGPFIVYQTRSKDIMHLLKKVGKSVRSKHDAYKNLGDQYFEYEQEKRQLKSEEPT